MDDLIPLRNGLRVLAVDRDSDSCELLTLILSQHGAETITATSVSEAAEKMQQSPPDIVITELILPHEDGYSLIKRLRALEADHGTKIPAIALTVCTEEHYRIQAFAAGFSRYLSKPVNIDELIETIASLTEPAQEVSTHFCS